MFNRKLKEEVRNLQNDVKELRDSYWKITDRYYLLLSELGFYLTQVYPGEKLEKHQRGE